MTPIIHIIARIFSMIFPPFKIRVSLHLLAFIPYFKNRGAQELP